MELQRADRCQRRPVSSGLDSNAQALGRIPLFEGLPTKEIGALAQQSRSRRYAAKESILRQDDPTRDVFFIIAGRVRVSAFSASGREISYRDLSAGQMFGELAAIDGQTRSATGSRSRTPPWYGSPPAPFVRLWNGMLSWRTPCSAG